jgi:ABC-type branched-subunit amino acid transport system substrate-binding protein
VKSEHPDAIKTAAIIAGDIDTATIQADRIKEAYETVGFDFVYEKHTAVIQESYAAEAKAMKDQGVEYVNFVNSTAEAVKLLRDMKTQSFKPEVLDFGQQYYDTDMLKAGDAAEGLLVLLNTVPFEEADDSPALAEYLEAYDKVGSNIQATSLGVQSFSAGLLFATAVKEVGNDLTRDSVLKQLHTIETWDGGGMHLVGHPGTNAVSTCFMYSEVEDGKFVRVWPKKAATFDCNDDYAIKLKGNYGEGAKLKGS